MLQPQRILLATDAWRPQVNGVVRTWGTSIAQLQKRGHEVAVIEPSQFTSFATPFYKEIRLAIPSRRHVSTRMRGFEPDVVHIATEGPIGLAVRASHPQPLAVHNLLSQQISRVPARVDLYSSRLDLSLYALVSWRFVGGHGFDADTGSRPRSRGFGKLRGGRGASI